MDALLTTSTDQPAVYAKMTGTVSVSGNYYNITVDGAATAVGSIYNATDAIKAKLVNGAVQTLYGYVTSISKSSGAAQ